MGNHRGDESPNIALQARSFRRDTIAWLVLFVLLGLGGGGYVWWKGERVFAPFPTAPDVKSPRIVILSYDRIVVEPDAQHVSQSQLQAQLEALKADGFHPVTVGQLSDFYLRRQALPAKPLLLLFEHGYSDSYELADPVLRALGWHAAMGVQTRRMDDRDTAFVYWHQLQAMVASGVWSVVAQGHESDMTVTGQGGEQGGYLTHRRWLASEQRLESDDEFSRRIEADLALAKEQLQQHLAAQPIVAFSYPQPLSRARPPERHLLEQRVAGLFEVALVDGLTGINDRHSPRQRLQRMRVTAELGGAELVQRLNRSLVWQAQAPPYWLGAAGQVTFDGDWLDMEGEPLAEAWLAGSQALGQWQLEATLARISGQFWLLLASEHSTRAWRVGGEAGGLTVQLLEAGQVVQTLATFPLDLAGSHRLKLIKRGAGIWVEWDGKPLSDTPIFLPARWRQGWLGWKSWHRAGVARLRVEQFQLRELPYRVREVSDNPSTKEIQALIDDAVDIAAIRYPAVVTYDDTPRHQETKQLLNILAHRYGWDLIPHHAPAGPDAGSPPAGGEVK